MPGLAPPKTAAGVNTTAGEPNAGGPGRAIALASVAPSAMASGSCASRAELAQTWAPPTELTPTATGTVKPKRAFSHTSTLLIIPWSHYGFPDQLFPSKMQLRDCINACMHAQPLVLDAVFVHSLQVVHQGLSIVWQVFCASFQQYGLLWLQIQYSQRNLHSNSSEEVCPDNSPSQRLCWGLRADAQLSNGAEGCSDAGGLPMRYMLLLLEIPYTSDIHGSTHILQTH